MTIDTKDQRSSENPAMSQRQPGDIFTNALGMMFAWIPPGKFLMGSPSDEKGRMWDGVEDQHSVTVTDGFFMGIHPVTQSEWRAVMGNNPSDYTDAKHPVKKVSWFEALLGINPKKKVEGDNHPVEMVSRHDCQDYCKSLSQRDGKPYRLPTEAEWEYACRAGTTTAYHFGSTICSDQANYNSGMWMGKGRKKEYGEQTTPVGIFPPNAWGLFDMHGNVWEWCTDWYGDSPNRDILASPPHWRGVQVTRGGSWNYNAEFCRSAERHWLLPGDRCSFVGCRVCFSLG
jgi:formylglycine-generating enzyme required for sulfatase activity